MDFGCGVYGHIIITSGGHMKFLIISTILINVISGAYAISSHKEYATYFETEVNKRLVHGRVVCRSDSDNFYRCAMKRDMYATADGYEYDYQYAKAHLDRVNKNIWREHGVPELYIRRE
jgi:hypothetical protein